MAGTRAPQPQGKSLGHLVRGAQAFAVLRGRPYVLPDDVKAVALDVLRHRITVSYEAEAEGVDGEEVGRRILEQVRVPSA